MDNHGSGRSTEIPNMKLQKLISYKQVFYIMNQVLKNFLQNEFYASHSKPNVIRILHRKNLLFLSQALHSSF